MGAMIWPFIQAANFKYVPARLRTIFVAFCSFFWNIGLSAIKASDHPFLVTSLLNSEKSKTTSSDL